MKKIINSVTFLISGLILASCMATLHPDVLNANTVIEDDTAVVLIGIQGQKPINYLQLCHSSIPCMNYRFPGTTNDVVALPMKKGINNLRLTTITYDGEVATYTHLGTSHGFYGINNAQEIDITQSGVTYFLTLNTDTRNASYNADQKFIEKAKKKYGAKITSQKANNFSW